jgi:hypothetical protein
MSLTIDLAIIVAVISVLGSVLAIINYFYRTVSRVEKKISNQQYALRLMLLRLQSLEEFEQKINGFTPRRGHNPDDTASPFLEE